MSDENSYTPPAEIVKKKKRTKPGGNNPSGLAKKPNITSSGEMMTPEVVGRVRRPHPWHMSVNELMEYKSSGIKPAMIIDPEILYKLGQIGVPLDHAASLCGVGMTFITEHKLYHDAWKLGVSQVGSSIRASLVEDALSKDVLNAKIYLDKVLNNNQVQQIQIEHSLKPANPLEAIPTKNLLDIMYSEEDESGSGN